MPAKLLSEPLEQAHDDTRIVVGVGCTSGAEAAEIVDLVMATMAEAGIARGALGALTSDRRKQDHPGLANAAAALGVPIWFSALPAEHRYENASAMAAQLELAGLAERAAAVFGPLVLGKRRSRHVTCAISRFQGDASAASASATVSTSRAGP